MNDFNQNPKQAASAWQEAEGFENYDKVLLGVSWDHAFSPKLTQKTSLFTSYVTNYEPGPRFVEIFHNYPSSHR